MYVSLLIVNGLSLSRGGVFREVYVDFRVLEGGGEGLFG